MYESKEKKPEISTKSENGHGIIRRYFRRRFRVISLHIHEKSPNTTRSYANPEMVFKNRPALG